MIPYFIVLFFSVAIAYFGRNSGNENIRRLSITATILLLIIFAGLRDRIVGTDTGTYINGYERINFSIDVWESTEIGFTFLMLACKFFTDEYYILLTAIATITVVCYTAGILQLSKRYETSIFLFITLGIYTFFFNGARQGIAASICFFALKWLLDRQKIPYFVLVGLAALFHHSALIAAPLYFTVSLRTGWRQIVAVVIGTVVMIIFLRVFVQFAANIFNDKYSSYAEAGDGGGFVMMSFLVFQGVILFILKGSVFDPHKRYQRLLNIYLIGMIPIIAAPISNVNPSGILRLGGYFTHTAILLWPMVFARIKNKSIRGLASLLFLTITLSFFALTTSNFSKLVPYQINQNFIW